MREEIIGDCRLILGDCREVLPTLGPVDAVVTDPPYGMNWNGKIKRGKNGSGKSGPSKNYGKTIIGDDADFDPSMFFGVKEKLFFGMNHFPEKLHRGTALIWIKRYDDGFGSFLSDAEIAWLNSGHGVYCKRDVSLQGESCNRFHPTQKPIEIMKWCLGFIKSQTILDPFMGSGTTGVACVKLGRKFIGIEMEPKYFDIACERIHKAYAQPDMFIAAPSKPVQEKML